MLREEAARLEAAVAEAAHKATAHEAKLAARTKQLEESQGECEELQKAIRRRGRDRVLPTSPEPKPESDRRLGAARNDRGAEPSAAAA